MNTYDSIGAGYDSTRQADPYLAGQLLHLLHARRGSGILDIGCGTGNYTCALSEQGLALTGIDPSAHMLDRAQQKSSMVRWVQGRVEDLPFADGSFDGVLATLTIHHWQDLDRGFAEVSRVLRPGGRFVLFTSTPEQMSGYWLGHYFPEMMARSSAVMPSLERVLLAAQRAQLTLLEQIPYMTAPDLRDQFLYAGKHHPERYLDAGFRQGISSFALMAPVAELDRGLQALSEDLRTGAWNAICARYVNDRGDYLHLAFER